MVKVYVVYTHWIHTNYDTVWKMYFVSRHFGDVISVLLFFWQAREMVELSKSIANKIKDKQGDITEDEVNRLLFKALETGLHK